MISDNDGPFVPFAPLTEADWVDNEFDFVFVRIIRMHVSRWTSGTAAR